MKRLVQWIQLPELSPLPVMDRVFEECLSAFKDDGCIVRRVYSWDILEDGGLVFLDDAAGHYKEHEFYHKQIAIQCPSSIMIGWYWKDPTYRPFPRMIVTGELYLHRERTDAEIRSYMLRPDFVPLGLRANEAPELIGTYPRTDTIDYCFMGGGYKQDWIPPNEFTGIYHRVIYNNYVSYEGRRSIYLSSRFALGFQSDENVRTGHLSQRIFEGLAYGCIVFCENPLATQFTNGAVIHVTSREDLWAKMREWKAAPDRIREQQQRGYEWVRKHGTNRTSMGLLWQRIQSRFQVEWTISSAVTVAVNIMGGLGNQLFQLAAGYTCAANNGAQFKVVRQDHNGSRSFYWDTLLQSCVRFLKDSLSLSLSTDSLSLCTLEMWQEESATVYQAIKSVNPRSNGLSLHGYFQSSTYFPTYRIKEQIRQLFRGPSDLEHSVYHSYPYLIRNAHRVVVLHARQTDYLLYREFHGPLDGAYYRRALDGILPHVPEPIFLLAGDDPSFWSHIKQDIPEVFLYPHIMLQKETDIRTFVLLQQFCHFIMSNSTFIWWVVWMARAKKVIVPKQWFGPTGPSQWSDIYEPTWEQV